jgi:hypothetical protein
MSRIDIDTSNIIFYYLKNQNKQKIITVCLIKYKECFSRGMSICSIADQFDRNEGRYWAMQRASKGIQILMNSEKPLTEKQIRQNRHRIKFLNLEEIKRGNAIDIVSSLARFDPKEDNPIIQEFPSLYKLSTCDESGLTLFEKRLFEKKTNPQG